MTKNPPLGLFALLPIVSRACSFAISWTLDKAGAPQSKILQSAVYLILSVLSAFAVAYHRSNRDNTRLRGSSRLIGTWILVAVTLRAVDEYTIFLCEGHLKWWNELLTYDVIGFDTLALSHYAWVYEGVDSGLEVEERFESWTKLLIQSIYRLLALTYVYAWAMLLMLFEFVVILSGTATIRHEGYLIIVGALVIMTAYLHWYFLRSKQVMLPQESVLPLVKG